MPELPEVENVVRSIAPYLLGRTIARAEFGSPWVTPGDRDLLARQLQGRRIERVRRHGKFILVDLDRGNLTIHLGMTGKLVANAPRTPYTHGYFELDADAVVVYDDIRQFGSIEWSEGVNPRVAALGPDALTVPPGDFVQGLRSRKTKLKPLLLNQAFVAGLGNIYVDELLFRAKLHPLQIASRISAPGAAELHGVMQRVLQESIAAGGSSISDYVDGEGRKGSFQDLHRVYGREGKPCLDCGAPVVRTVVAQRGTHLCPQCQKRR
ncbi:MAG: bifunctional DNA-formamidopyrimidine glycosylase/DNA-(apurinic or apyrimidinic site) lyase [Acidobacteria bacterium]|nr:bifunctional DNA-formamidopyrimidine glycosylase/DNA-(apurinic or apyrimidinic site) lyase [Acidobacteriota bacterium]